MRKLNYARITYKEMALLAHNMTYLQAARITYKEMALLTHNMIYLQDARHFAADLMRMCVWHIEHAQPTDFPYKSFSFRNDSITVGFATWNDARTFCNLARDCVSRRTRITRNIGSFEPDREEDLTRALDQFRNEASDLMMRFVVDPIAFANLRSMHRHL